MAILYMIFRVRVYVLPLGVTNAKGLDISPQYVSAGSRGVGDVGGAPVWRMWLLNTSEQRVTFAEAVIASKNKRVEGMDEPNKSHVSNQQSGLVKDKLIIFLAHVINCSKV